MTTKLPPIKTGADGGFSPPEDGWIHISPFGRYPVKLADSRAAEIVIDPASAAAQVAAFQADAAAAGAAWGGLLYVSLFSMWLGFFAWYRGLALGGLVRVSQVQLLQPFLALLFAVPVLGEPLEPVTVGFALAVLAVVFLGRRMPVGQPRVRRDDAGPSS